MNYTGTGTIRILGCASPIKLVQRYPHSFGVGEKVYIRKSATLKGKLEPVYIKSVNRVMPSSPTKEGILAVFNYVDTLNGVWLEEELVWQADAVDLATAYWEKIQAQAAVLAENCTAE